MRKDLELVKKGSVYAIYKVWIEKGEEKRKLLSVYNDLVFVPPKYHKFLKK